MEVSRIHEGGSAAMIVSLLAHNMLQFKVQIPDQVIVFDPSVQVSCFSLFILHEWFENENDIV